MTSSARIQRVFEGRGVVPLGTRLFRSRVQLLTHVQATPDLDPDTALAGALTTTLHGEVAAMNRENFIVRMHLEAVDRFRERTTWAQLSDSDREMLQREVAGLPSEVETDAIESRMFDLTALRMQVALAEGHRGAVERHRQRMVEIAMLLEEKTTIPAVQGPARIPGLHAGERLLGGARPARSRRVAAAPTQTGTLPRQEEADTIVYTDFQDQVIGVRDEEVVHMPKMTGVQYEKKVNDYLRNHLDHIVIHRLRTNQPLTATDVQGLETTLAEIGEDDGQTLLTGLLARSEEPSLAHFVRNMVGMDRVAAQSAFSGFLSDQSLTPPQIRFVEMVIDQLTARGVMEASALYEPPFSHLHAGGPEALFGGRKNVIEGIFDTLKAVQSGLMVKVG